MVSGLFDDCEFRQPNVIADPEAERRLAAQAATTHQAKGKDLKAIIVELCQLFYTLGWVTGTGGGISIRENGVIYMAPSGVQKERIQPEDIYEMDMGEQVLRAPTIQGFKPSQCLPLFFNAYRIRDAGACIHTHSIHAVLATLIAGESTELRISKIEMIKGIEGHSYDDELVVPIIENTAHERDLASSMAQAMIDYPRSNAVLVRRHGVYVWGRDWAHAKTQCECYDYLFQCYVEMAKLKLL
eukprot:TRINITY_DN9811_c0_g1::TRINITY_DN9811_c0_g1_i1::g.4898::m.4898 TRINITY_DN9811_c0_g1::TRINITY_DN9811_c0_g1_i1::g.4898  ORF type:complete len:264 (+),score=12.46,sp/Q54NY7/MTNB_DICDI/59.13/1e-76,Aldolase_II/PF00596.16/3.4e-42 TRINITY_DN9811_c0_g1_i1:69-794(+)